MWSLDYAKAVHPADAERFFRELEDMSRERIVGAGAGNLALAYLTLGDAENAAGSFRPRSRSLY